MTCSQFLSLSHAPPPSVCLPLAVCVPSRSHAPGSGVLACPHYEWSVRLHHSRLRTHVPHLACVCVDTPNPNHNPNPGPNPTSDLEERVHWAIHDPKAPAIAQRAQQLHARVCTPQYPHQAVTAALADLLSDRTGQTST